MRLYELADQYETLLEMASDDTGNDMLAEYIAGMEGKIEEKVENTMKVVRSLEADAAAIKLEEDRLKKRRDSLEKNARYLKDNIGAVMNQLDIEKIKGPIFTVWMQQNNPKVVVLDDFAIPQQFYIVPPSVPQLQKAAIIEAWKGGSEIPGVQVVQEKSLRVR